MEIKGPDLRWRSPSTDAPLSLDLRAVKSIDLGKTTPNFQKKTSEPSPDDCCFSLLSSSGAVDIEMADKHDRDVLAYLLQEYIDSLEGEAAVGAGEGDDEESSRLLGATPTTRSSGPPPAHTENVVAANAIFSKGVVLHTSHGTKEVSDCTIFGSIFERVTHNICVCLASFVRG